MGDYNWFNMNIGFPVVNWWNSGGGAERELRYINESFDERFAELLGRPRGADISGAEKLGVMAGVGVVGAAAGAVAWAAPIVGAATGVTAATAACSGGSSIAPNIADMGVTMDVTGDKLLTDDVASDSNDTAKTDSFSDGTIDERSDLDAAIEAAGSDSSDAVNEDALYVDGLDAMPEAGEVDGASDAGLADGISDLEAFDEAAETVDSYQYDMNFPTVPLELNFCTSMGNNSCLSADVVPQWFKNNVATCLKMDAFKWNGEELTEAPTNMMFLDPFNEAMGEGVLNFVEIAFSGNNIEPADAFADTLIFEPSVDEFDYNPYLDEYQAGTWYAYLPDGDYAMINAAIWDGLIMVYFNSAYAQGEQCQSIYNNPCQDWNMESCEQ